jgi:hypothetical protein
LAISALLLGLVAAPTYAATVTLTDHNSSAAIDPDSQNGMFNWTISGVDSMFQQWFWYRVGATGGEHSIDTLASLGQQVSNTNLDPGLDTLSIERGSADGLEIDVTYILRGGANGAQVSDIGETITITNHGNTSLDLHFFQYSDFDLCGAIGGQTVTFVNSQTVDQTGGGCNLSETVVTPAANEHQADTFANILNSLNDGSPTTLNGSNSATGDGTWGFEWDRNLAAGGSFQISKDKNISPVPEPASLLLLGTGLLSLGGAARRRFLGKKA